MKSNISAPVHYSPHTDMAQRRTAGRRNGSRYYSEPICLGRLVAQNQVRKQLEILYGPLFARTALVDAQWPTYTKIPRSWFEWAEEYISLNKTIEALILNDANDE
jgi:hypothetical protein